MIQSYQSDDFHIEYYMNQFQEESGTGGGGGSEDEERKEDGEKESDNYRYSSFNHKKIFCTNCGKNGHIYKKCTYPVTSVGIICVSFAPLYYNDMIYYIKRFQAEHQESFNADDLCKLQKIYENIKNIDEFNYDKIIKYLMIQRKHTYSYVELIRGKYELDHMDYIYNTIQYMTNEEKRRILHLSFEELWNDLWYKTPTYIQREKDMNIAKEKFELLKNGVFIKKNDITVEYSLQKMIQNNKQKPYLFPEWGFPKGRRNLKEKNVECAHREFQEETNLTHQDYQIMNVSPVEEMFMGMNHIRYKNIYYMGQTSRKIELKIENDLQKMEIGDIQWLPFQQCLDFIREYDIEKRNVISNTHFYIKTLFFIFQKRLKEFLGK
jgi:hypothetical protein